MVVRGQRALETLWTWSFGGLPGWFVLPGFLRRWSREVYVNSWPTSRTDWRAGEIIDITLGPELQLEKKISLPLAARPNLTRVIDLNMRQSLPGGGADLVWCHSAGIRNQSKLDVSVFLLKKSILDEMKEVSTERGARLRSIYVAAEASAQPFWDDRKRLDRPRRVWGGLTLALALVVLGLVSWREAEETTALQSRVAALEAQKQALGAEAVALRGQLEAQNTSLSAIARDLDVFRSEFQRLPALLDLTETLTDETWISELHINGQNLHLSGFTGRDVTEVITSVRGLPWVERVDLDGPVSFDSFSRRNRFDIRIAMQLQFADLP